MILKLSQKRSQMIESRSHPSLSASAAAMPKSEDREEMGSWETLRKYSCVAGITVRAESDTDLCGDDSSPEPAVLSINAYRDFPSLLQESSNT